MAEWTNIPDSNLEPGKPIRSTDGLALRDNPVAIAEGADGAPRIQTAALADESVTLRKLYKTTAGSYVASLANDGSITTTSYAKVIEWQVGAGGTVTVRFTFDVTGGTTGLRGWARVYVNGTAVGQERYLESYNVQTYSENISVSAGDKVQIYGKGDSTVDATIQSPRIMIGNPLVPMPHLSYGG